MKDKVGFSFKVVRSDGQPPTMADWFCGVLAAFLCAFVIPAMLAMLFIFAVLSVAGEARANGPSYGYGYQQTYPTYEAWQWGKYPSDHSYFVKWRWVNRGYGQRTWETDGKLYTRKDGVYSYWKDIRDYSKGDAIYGANEAIKKLELAIPGIVKFAEHVKSPDALNPRDFLPADSDNEAARLASNERALEMIVRSREKTDSEAGKRQLELDRLKVSLAERTATLNAIERAGTSAQQIAVDGIVRGILASGQRGGEEVGQLLGIDDPELERDIRVSCFACHGGANDKGTAVRFDDIGSIDWTDVLTSVATGDMPKGGEAWDNAQLARLKAYAKKHK